MDKQRIEDQAIQLQKQMQMMGISQQSKSTSKSSQLKKRITKNRDHLQSISSNFKSNHHILKTYGKRKSSLRHYLGIYSNSQSVGSFDIPYLTQQQHDKEEKGSVEKMALPDPPELNQREKSVEMGEIGSQQEIEEAHLME